MWHVKLNLILLAVTSDFNVQNRYILSCIYFNFFLRKLEFSSWLIHSFTLVFGKYRGVILYMQTSLLSPTFYHICDESR